MLCLLIHPPFQTMCRVTTDCPTLAAMLRLKHGKYISSGPSCSAGLEIEAIRQDGGYRVRFRGETCVTASALQEIDRILFENTIYDHRVFALHGGAVEWNGKAYLFLAPTGSGKTTLTSFLVSRGFGYLTDDCILLDREDFRVYPYSAPIHLRGGGLSVLETYNAAPPKLQVMGDVSLARYVYTPGNAIEQAVPLGGIFFSSRTDTGNQVVEMSTNQRLLALMNAPITNYKVHSAYLQFLTRLAKTDCRKLVYSDMEYVAEVIRNGC